MKLDGSREILEQSGEEKEYDQNYYMKLSKK